MAPNLLFALLTVAFLFITITKEVDASRTCSSMEDCRLATATCECGIGYYCSEIFEDSAYCKIVKKGSGGSKPNGSPAFSSPSSPVSTPSIRGPTSPSVSPPSYRVPTKSTVTRTPKGRCFPGSSLLRLHDGKTVRMDEVSVGDLVASVDDEGNLEYSPVIYIPHLENDYPSDFVEITCKRRMTSVSQEDDNATIETPAAGSISTIRATDKHILFTSEEEHESFHHVKAVPAEKVMVGSWMHTISGEGGDETRKMSTSACVVTQVDKVQGRGIYSVFTKNGRVVVDGVVASSYVGDEWILGEDHKGAHMLTVIHRIAYELGLAESILFRYFNDCLNSVFGMI